MKTLQDRDSTMFESSLSKNDAACVYTCRLVRFVTRVPLRGASLEDAP